MSDMLDADLYDDDLYADETWWHDELLDAGLESVEGFHVVDEGDDGWPPESELERQYNAWRDSDPMFN